MQQESLSLIYSPSPYRKYVVMAMCSTHGLLMKNINIFSMLCDFASGGPRLELAFRRPVSSWGGRLWSLPQSREGCWHLPAASWGGPRKTHRQSWKKKPKWEWLWSSKNWWQVNDFPSMIYITDGGKFQYSAPMIIDLQSTYHVFGNMMSRWDNGIF